MSKFDFGSINVSADKEIEYIFHQVESSPKPVLIVKQATEANKPYWNGVLRRNSAATRRLRGGRLTAAIVDETRESDRELFPKHVVSGWRDVVDVEGVVVPFTQTDCLDFLRALPTWVFDEFRNFVADIQNFIDGDLADEEATSGN